jgi:hypothetical protein
MHLKIHRTTLMDGHTVVTDVDIMPNTRPGFKPRCIMTFNTGDDALDFANRLNNLCSEFGASCTTEVTDES